MPTNIKFNYEYRDAGGNRRGGCIVFAWSGKTKDIKSIESQLRGYLFDEEFFYPYKLSIPLIHFEQWDHELDHDWYYFECLEPTEEETTDPRPFEEFLSDMQKFAKQPSFIS